MRHMDGSQLGSAGRRERRVLTRVSRRPGGWSMPDGNGHGRWPRPAPGDLDPRPGRGGRAVTLTDAPARGRCRPGCAGRGAGHQHKPSHKSTPQRPRRLAQRHPTSVKLTLLKIKCTVAFMKHYGQACAIARALDVVGERWSLLLVRELALGPRRYRDLATGLPGIPSNVLAARLKDLQAAGVITQRTLPAPTDVTRYELTHAGRALQPALKELLDWGLRYGPEPPQDEPGPPSRALLAGAGRPTALPAGQTCELGVGPESFYLISHAGKLTVRRWPAPDRH